MHKQLKLAAAIIAVGLNMASSAHAGNESSPETCRRALSVLGAETDKAIANGDLLTVAFYDERKQAPSADGNLAKSVAFSPENVMRGWSGVPPSKALVGAWFKADLRSIFSCSSSGEQTKSPPILSVRQAADLLGRSAGDVNAPHLYSATSPVFDSSGSAALVFVSKWGNSVGGFSKLAVIEFKAGRWVEVGSRVLSVS